MLLVNDRLGSHSDRTSQRDGKKMLNEAIIAGEVLCPRGCIVDEEKAGTVGAHDQAIYSGCLTREPTGRGQC